MQLPEQIPKRLRALAVILPEFDDGVGAWLRDDAVAVIDSLRGTTVPVAEVVLYERVPGGYQPSGAAWWADRRANESDTDYARRSRLGAVGFIQGRESTTQDALFALTFPLWKDAA